MKEIKITNMLKFYTLFLLATGPKHGYDLIRELGFRMNRKVSASNVYPFLESLSKNKLITYNKIGKRDKKIFHLTKSGERFTQEMFSKFGDLINMAMETKVTLCPCGCKVYSGGHSEKINGKMVKFCCSHCAKTYRKI